MIELERDAQSARDLAAGGVFVPGCALRLAEECDLVVCGANHRLLIPARVVYVDRQRGAGLELIGFSTEMKAQLAALEPLVQPQLGVDDEPVFEESSFDGSTLDGLSFDRVAPPDGDFVSGEFTEPVPLIDLHALDDDLAIPIATGGGARERRVNELRTRYGHAAGHAQDDVNVRARAEDLPGGADDEARHAYAQNAYATDAHGDAMTRAAGRDADRDAATTYTDDDARFGDAGGDPYRDAGGDADRDAATTYTDDNARFGDAGGDPYRDAGGDVDRDAATTYTDDNARFGDAGGDPYRDAAATYTDDDVGSADARGDPYRDAATTYTDADADDQTAGDTAHGYAAGVYAHADPDDQDAGGAGDAATALDGADDLDVYAGGDTTAGAGDAATADPASAGAEVRNTDADDTLDPDGGLAHGGDPDAGDPHDPVRAARRLTRNVHERLRGLTLVAQLKMASNGELHERIVLERLYGKNVWETLLRNPRLSPPEVSRIARYGSLPRVLLDLIVGNNAWLQIPEIRRALLTNPRLATDQIVKILRLTPKHELKLATIQTAYPPAVRSVARMLMRSE